MLEIAEQSLTVLPSKSASIPLCIAADLDITWETESQGRLVDAKHFMLPTI
jgi:hypothetical protein